MRNCRAEHLYQTVGVHKLNAMSARLHDPCYSIKKEYGSSVNAFVHPKNPDATFPQTSKPIIHDFRSHKMDNGGLTAVNVFRKHLLPNAKQSKYKTRTMTREEADAEEAMRKEKKLKKQTEEISEDDNVVLQEPEQPISVDELMTLTDKLKIGKKSKKERAEEEAAAQITIKSKGIKKKNENFKKAKRQLLFK